MTSDDHKSAMRVKARARRRDAARRAAPDAGRRIAAHAMDVLAGERLAPRPVVAGYWPVGSEADVRPLLNGLAAAGMRCVLPVVQARSRPLVFRAWRPGDALVDGVLGTRQPSDDKARLRPDVVLAPMLAFDDAGYRLGQGGGYYDRTIEGLRAAGRVLVVGVAFAAQRQDAVPRAAHDQRLDWIVTEAGAHRFE